MRTFEEMEQEFYKSVRHELLDGLLLTTPGQQLLFKRMYAHKDLSQPIAEVVANMSRDRLSWAMHQVTRTHEIGRE